MVKFLLVLSVVVTSFVSAMMPEDGSPMPEAPPGMAIIQSGE